MNHFRVHKKWLTQISKQEANYLQTLAPKLFQDHNKIVWVRLSDYKYPRTALYLPQKYRKMALCEAHNNQFGGHNAALKTYIRISSSYYWPKIYSDVLNHTKSCLRCQQRKKSTHKPPPLQPLPIPDKPNMRIHADLFGPMLAAGRQHKYILCITDAFTKYAMVTAVENKEAETVAKAIFSEWFCKFGIPAQIHTDGGKEFVNKLSNELFSLLNVNHTKTTPAHPQCNAQVEVFNKTVKKYLASFVDDTTLDWENFLPALMLSYNTSYHSTIATTPFELLFGEKPRLPSFPNPDIYRMHYGESSAAERYQLLQKIRFLAKNIAEEQGEKTKDNFDKKAFPHEFKINDLVLYEDFSPLGKNAKLTPKWLGPAKITEINDTNARIQLPNGKSKIINIMRIKKFFQQKDTNSESEQNKTVSGSGELDFNAEQNISGPVTRAMKKLLEQQKATNLAISVLCDLSKKHCSMCEWEQECSDNPLLFDPIFARQYIKERKSWLINKQSICAKCKLQLGEHLLDNQAASSSIHHQCHDFSTSDKIPAAKHDEINFTDNFPFQDLNSDELINKQKELRHAQNLINERLNLINEQREASVFNKNDEINSDGEIFLINETLRKPLMHIANKLLGRQRLSFEQLTTPEQNLWSLFEKSDIFEFLTGQKDTVPQFENFLTFGAAPKVNINIQRIAQNLHPILPTQNQVPIQRAVSDPTQVTHFLRERKAKIDYKALHLGQQIQNAAKEVKQKCKQMKKSVRKSAKATVTKLAPGAFSPKQETPASAPASPRPSSSSSWTFWPSK
jgi:transposase InsO family protein